MKKLFAVVVISTVAAVSPAGQSQTETPEQGPTFRTGVDLIAVDVSVVDRDGRPVEDLLAPEFVVEICWSPDRQRPRLCPSHHRAGDTNALDERGRHPTQGYCD